MAFKILFINKTHSTLKQSLEKIGCNCEEDYTSNKTEIEQKIHQYDGIIIRSRINIDKHFIDQTKDLLFIARAGVGVEHIDVQYAESQGVKVLTSPEGSRDTVGEHAIGMLLALMNNLVKADAEIKQGTWDRNVNRGIEIKGKTIGILGYGNMGSAFAKKISGFEAKVLAYDKFKTGYGDEFAKEVELEKLFEEVEILTIHIPYSTENHHFINDNFLQKFRKPIFVINTARGLVLNTEDLVKNLKSGKVRGAALDVLEYEEQSFDDWQFNNLPAAFDYLVKAKNVVLTPHVAGLSFESRAGHAKVLARKIEDMLRR